jgi:hypothetical protein
MIFSIIFIALFSSMLSSNTYKTGFYYINGGLNG